MGFFDKLKKITTNLFSTFTEADEAFFEELEETLILADLGMETAVETVEKLRERVRRNGLRDQEEVKAALRAVLVEELDIGTTELNVSTTPSVMLFIGVNGVGKTTSIGKLAYLLKMCGKRCLLCAADTFRAAAADQLEIWAERAPGRCCLMRSRPPRLGVWMWCSATRRGGFIIRQTSWRSLPSFLRSLTGSAPARPGRLCWSWTPPQGRTAWFRPEPLRRRRD